mgnify:CR=1 FL=1
MIKNRSELEMLQQDRKQSKVKMYRQVIRCFLYASMQAYERVQRRKIKPKIESCIVEWAVRKFHEYEDAKSMEASVFNAFVRRKKEERAKDKDMKRVVVNHNEYTMLAIQQ